MYNPKEFKFCFHVDMQQVHIKPCKISSKGLLVGSEEQWLPAQFFFQLRSKINMNTNIWGAKNQASQWKIWRNQEWATKFKDIFKAVYNVTSLTGGDLVCDIYQQRHFKS